MMRRIALKAARLEKNKLQRIAAKEIGISTVFLVKLESGKRKPGRDTLIRISNYYQKPAEELFPDLFCAFNDT
ncbi:helix-turn-helix transcriptional regulator [Brevibacillus sp. 7WMA2]|uniref:helix-turn-helix transcriptional regulator n=1 Tax=Brevibacillus sp. 7WMA2 TaxID=2683193 RepID=UPI00128F3451|nr:helix-turn-helix transcriptional regulator [Brevibacillus sp. 7WMA2]QIC08173.1 helix-turn-helix transcriptional regulator [Brevibacillus sp. 7WMA2]